MGVLAMTYRVSKIDVAALKKADRVVFRHIRGESQIEAIKEADERNPFEQVRAIPCGAKFVDYSERKVFGPALDTFTGFEMFHTPNYNEEWTTIIGLLREGDELTLVWTRDGFTAQTHEDAALHGDRLSLAVKRGEKTMRFHLETRVCPDNTARMIRSASPQFRIAS